MDRRSIIAFALALGVLALYPIVIKQVYPDAYKNNQHTAAKSVPGSAVSGGAVSPSSSGTAASTLTDAASVAGLFTPSDDVVFHGQKARRHLQ